MDFLCQYNNSIPHSLCNEIIEMFELEDKTDGITIGGVNKEIKDTTDFSIPKSDEKWKKIETFLYKELSSKLSKYLKKHCKSNYDSPYRKYKIFGDQTLFTHSFMIQKYEKQKGKYTYHDDFFSYSKSFRVITYLWYLNTVEEGGETIMWDNYSIKPEQGKLLLFPSFWTFPHTGKIPVSSDKYIIVGWLYINQY